MIYTNNNVELYLHYKKIMFVRERDTERMRDGVNAGGQYKQCVSNKLKYEKNEPEMGKKEL